MPANPDPTCQQNNNKRTTFSLPLSSSHPLQFSRNIVGLKQRCFSENYSLSLTPWIFFLFLLFLIFLHRSSFLLLPLSSLENSINKPENSINKPKNFTSTQTHVNLSPFGLDLVMAARQMRRWQQGRSGGSNGGRVDWFPLGFSCGFMLDFSYGFSVGFSLSLTPLITAPSSSSSFFLGPFFFFFSSRFTGYFFLLSFFFN